MMTCIADGPEPRGWSWCSLDQFQIVMEKLKINFQSITSSLHHGILIFEVSSHLVAMCDEIHHSAFIIHHSIKVLCPFRR
jgi:hypothetical protein